MIITKLQGGLGNQMFQYAAGLALAQHHKTTLKLDVSWFDRDERANAHEKYGLSCFNICEQFASLEECERYFPERREWVRNSSVGRLFRGLTRMKVPGSYFSQSIWGFEPAFWNLPINSYLDGFFQSPKYFEKIGALLRLHFSFRYPPSEKVSCELEQIRASSPSVFIDFRRGDYISEKSVFEPPNLDFYRRAISEIKTRVPNCTAFIFSDEVHWVEKHFSPDMPHHFVRVTDQFNFFDKIRLMSSCDHAILSNSTFAWWGAWLIDSNKKLVIAPEPWHPPIHEPFKDLELSVEGWLSLARGALSE